MVQPVLHDCSVARFPLVAVLVIEVHVSCNALERAQHHRLEGSVVRG